MTRIPSGEEVTLQPGTEVIITQALGGSYTLLIPSHAGLYRLEGKDADAIGRTPETKPQPIQPHQKNPSKTWSGTNSKPASTPEIPVNIVDLGLIYEMTISENEQAGRIVDVKMTLTAPGCGMGPIIAAKPSEKSSPSPRSPKPMSNSSGIPHGPPNASPKKANKSWESSESRKSEVGSRK